MLVVMNQNVDEAQINNVINYVKDRGFDTHLSKGALHTVIGVVGQGQLDPRNIELLDGVSEVIKITSPYKLVSRQFQTLDTIIEVNGVKIGGNNLGLIAGPCSIETVEQMDEVASQLSKMGVKILRGGAFKPRTSPYAFQGLGEEGLKIMRAVCDKYKMACTCEIMDASHIDMFLKYVDVFQVGARNMQNFTLLKELGKINCPVVLKRGLCSTIEEWLMSAEYIMSGGNRNVILCERGIRTFEKMTRNTLDLSAIPIVKKISHLPIIVDPSHATGLRDKVEAMSMASVACGCDGLIIEVHNNPDRALCDGAQSLYPIQFEHLLSKISQIAPIVNKTLA